MRFLSLLLLLLVTLFPVAAKDELTDDHLYDRIRIQIANDREIGGNPIEVKVTNGNVELTGKVRTDKQKVRAEKVAKKVKGVKSVVNNIAISPL
ncbi:MAG: BON domain-containing protein [Bryobacteraceae bacterium]|nr:BON domain-containing protein [Bryobacteraceae bacterium]